MTHDNDDIDFEPAPPDKVYAHNRRQLSAMLDGELSPDQARFMLRRLRHDTELAGCWERWQVCGDILRGRGHALLPADFSQRVAAAIAAPAGTAAAPVAAAGGRAAPRPPHRLLRWGGGALAASVAMVALFMARQLPDAQAPELAEAGSPARTTPALVQPAPPPALAAAGDVDPSGPLPAESGRDAPLELLASAAPAAIAVAEVPRRAAARGTGRSQSQRAAARRAQATAADVPLRAVAAAPAPVRAVPPAGPAAVDAVDAGLPVFAGAPAAGDALFGAPAAAAPRPWPRAVMPGLSGRSAFSAGYGLPQAGAFAPFQPRLDRVPMDPAAADANRRSPDAVPGPGPGAGGDPGGQRPSE